MHTGRVHPAQTIEAPALPTDAALVAAAQCSPTAFAPLYARYRNEVLRYYFYCLGDWEEAADAAQQVFANVIAGLPRFVDRGDSFRSWLFRIAHNEVCTRQQRQARQWWRPLVEADLVVDQALSPEALAITADDHERLRLVLGALPPDRRRVCDLRLAGLTDQEIAHILGKSHGAVRAAQARAVRQLRGLHGIGLARAGEPHA
jgi:RNA polymerase sigma-70 factor, ECF subfamily